MSDHSHYDPKLSALVSVTDPFPNASAYISSRAVERHIDNRPPGAPSPTDPPRPPNDRLVSIFHLSERRCRDIQNIPAIDGIAQAMVCDDNGFVVSWPEQFGSCAKGGCVLVEVEDYGNRGAL